MKTLGKHIIFLFVLGNFLFFQKSYAQLNPQIIKEVAESKADKLQQYFNLSEHRRGKAQSIILKHELAKEKIIKENLENLNDALSRQENILISELSEILTKNEIKLFMELSRLDLKDDKEYLTTLTEVYDADEEFIKKYMNFRNKEMLPKLMQLRLELDEQVSTEDKRTIESLRSFIYEVFDRCLVTCVINDQHDSHEEDDLGNNSNLLLNLNRELQSEESKLGILLNIVQQYEDAIHQLRIDNKKLFDYWNTKTKMIKQEYILPNHGENLKELKRRSEVATIRHIESEAIFLLLDPIDERRSRYFFNFGLLNDL